MDKKRIDMQIERRFLLLLGIEIRVKKKNKEIYSTTSEKQLFQ